MLILTIVTMWNRNKGPIDVFFSRFMKNCHSARHATLSSDVENIWLRLLMTRVYNAYQTFVMSRSVAFRICDDCSGYAAFQKHRKKHGSFAKFCSSALARDLTLERFVRDDGSDDSSIDAAGDDIERKYGVLERRTTVRYHKCDA